MKKTLLLFGSIFALIFCLPSSSSAHKAPAKYDFEISPDKPEGYFIENDIKYSRYSGLPLALYNPNYAVTPASPEAMAEQFIRENHQLLGLSYPNLKELYHHATRTSLSGHVVRYRQQYEGLPVGKSEITIHINHKNVVTYVLNDYRRGIKLTSVAPNLNLNQAKTLAHAHIRSSGDLDFEDSRLMVYYYQGTSRLAYEITIIADQPLGEWHVFVDAHTGEIFKAVDMASYYCSHEHKSKQESHSCSKKEHASFKMMATGTGNVFDPDPLSSAQVAYGATGYTDSNDANSTQLQSQLMNVTLLDIEETGGVYKLAGPYAEVTDWDSPSTGLFTQNSPDFFFNREEQGFEATNIYYHIDYSMRYINETLMINILPFQYSGGVQYDPHGAGGADNSYYTPSTGRLSFGEGCVDDGEDSDVIHHELGHGIHDWATNGNSSGSEGLGEGSGDYWAQSYNRGLGNWGPTDPQYNYMFNWDGHNECWGGRTTAYGASYPGGLTGSIHTDGQIWATCLMEVWDQIGQEQTDRIFLEGLSMTNGSSGQNDAAVAAFQSAQDMGYSMADLTAIYNTFTACGYTLPTFNVPPTVEFSADAQVVCLDDGGVVNFMDLSTGEPTSFQWTFPGGTPSSSTDQNPTVTYSSVGVYDVTLAATNATGTTTETYTGYITVVAGQDCPSCTMNASADVPVDIPISGTPTVTSILTITDAGSITDVNVLNLEITHTWISDLDVTLSSPSGTSVQLFTSICGSDDNLSASFDDEAASGTLPCPPTDGNTYQPTGSLANLIGEPAAGTWTLTIADTAGGDGGELTGWTLEVCTADAGCTGPTATFMVTEDCINGYSVDISVTDLGSSSSYNISDGSTSLGTISNTGTTTVGPFTNDTPVTLTLEHDTDAFCNLSSSNLVNPNECPTLVDCSSPLNASYCYDSNNTDVLGFESNDGSPLTLTINTGGVENTYDNFIVYDSDGVTELYNDYGNAGDISGLTFTSTGSSISWTVASDGTVSCVANSTCCVSGIDYTVSCEMPTQCDTPTNISHTLISPTRCQILWDAVPGALWYDVHYRIGGSGSTGWLRAPTVDNERTLNYLAPDTQYDYIVRASCDGTWSFADASPIRRFNTTNAPAAREGEFPTHIVGLSPNPANDMIRLEYTASSSEVSISITDIMGRVVYQNQLSDIEGYQNEVIDVSSLGKGYYFLVLQSGDERTVQKFATVR